MRLTLGSNLILSPLRAYEKTPWFVAIEVLGSAKPNNLRDFEHACQELTSALSENQIEFAFHWPKMWDDVHKNGRLIAAKQFMKDFVTEQKDGKSRLSEFKEIYQQICSRSGLQTSDYKMFCNKTLEFIFADLFT